ncbi:hypothetical protein WISP_65328 [Willisornis vidua]|uniref:Uncharacterized protein n=1 Tax=Willisornis vidua TaxID=1566151 RepID=A0ABQ9D9A7_9PASS|nr:hypothetical protein WISP_65328 [Willisornis vidua]
MVVKNASQLERQVVKFFIYLSGINAFLWLMSGFLFDPVYKLSKIENNPNSCALDEMCYFPHEVQVKVSKGETVVLNCEREIKPNKCLAEDSTIAFGKAGSMHTANFNTLSTSLYKRVKGIDQD